MNLNTSQYCLLCEIDRFFEVSGYELFGSEETNCALLLKIFKEYVRIANIGCFPISFHVVNYRGNLRLLYGAPKEKLEALCGVLTGNMSSVMIHFVPSLREAVPALDALQTFSGVIIGSGNNLEPNLDMILNTLDKTDYMFSVIASPCRQSELREEIDRTNTFLDIYQVLSQHQLLYGSNTHRNMSQDNHNVLDLIDLLNTVKMHLGQVGGLWKTYISICACDAVNYSKAYSAFSSGLISTEVDHASTEGGVSLVTFPQRPFAFDTWTLPRAFLGSYDFGGLYSNSFDNLLLSSAIAALFTLPTRAHRGISVRQHGKSRESEYGAFSKYAPQMPSKGILPIGTVTGTGEQFNILLPALRQHTFITGFTQCGKTTTTLQILSEAAKAQIPFVVLEAAKKQYCELLGREQFAGTLRVYSGGYDTKLLHINPFQPEVGTILDNHIQSLVALLTALFDEQAPLPQILNLLVYKAYESKGWSPKDRIRHLNHREFPTFSTMITLIDDVVDEIGYSTKYSETADNMKGVIRGRLTSIIQGAMDDVLNSSLNISVQEMFETSTIVELDDFSELNKTFVAGVLALKTYEYSRSQDYGSDTRRLLVIEEAHNIVPNVDGVKANANTVQCSKHFTSMLAEVAAYGTDPAPDPL